MYEVGLCKPFEAWHTMPGAPGPEGQRHAHAYRLDVVVRRRALDERGMVVDLDVLQAAVDRTVGEVAGKDLDETLPPSPHGVTVEYLAKWAHEAISAAVLDGGADELSVRAWESPEAFGGYFGRPDKTSS
jgi:6-pyruvoyltetrahydropterin/6-carboxytetrahydropterin synthase